MYRWPNAAEVFYNSTFRLVFGKIFKPLCSSFITICCLKVKQLLRIRRHSTHCRHRAPSYIWSKPSKFGFTEVFLLQTICDVFKNKFCRLPLSYSNDFSVVRSVSTFTFSSISTNISGKKGVTIWCVTIVRLYSVKIFDFFRVILRFCSRRY